MKDTVKVPTSFWIISGIGLLWNSVGVYSFYSDLTISAEALKALTDAQRQLYENVPSWIYIVYGIAVVAATIGCIALLLRRSWAVSLFLASLAAVIIQFGHSFFLTNAVEAMGLVAVIMPVALLGIALGLYFYSKKCLAMGWIT